MSALLEVEGLHKTFGGGSGLFGAKRPAVRAVDSISFSLARGETLGLVGETGSGKSTLGRLVLRLIEPSAGTVRFEGQDVTAASKAGLRALRPRMQMVFQDPYGSLDPRMTAGAIIAEPMVAHGIARAEASRRAAELLSRVGLSPAMAARYPHEFSGGQRQRIGIARALAAEPDLIICDEAVSALDVSVKAQIVNLLQDLQKDLGLALLFISHDLAIVEHMTHRVAVMYLGKIVEVAPKRELFAAPKHPYTEALLSAVPVPEPGAQRERVILKGDVPSPINPPKGCRFHTRCPYAFDRCRQDEPALRQTEPGHWSACHLHDRPAAENPLAGAKGAALIAKH